MSRHDLIICLPDISLHFNELRGVSFATRLLTSPSVAASTITAGI